MLLDGPIKAILAHKNPTLDTSRQDKSTIREDNEYYPLSPSYIVPWDDFTYENIASALNDVLEDPKNITVDVLQNPGGLSIEIESEQSIQELIATWNASICHQPLSLAAPQLQQNLGLLAHPIAIQAPGKEIHHDRHEYAPGLSIHLLDDAQTPLVWGHCVRSTTWMSDHSELPRRHVNTWTLPFQQVLTYCVATNTRYGCILTPEELVILRFYQTPSDGEPAWGAEYKSIPWADSGPNKLTANLGIWAMGMMALNNKHRAISGREDTLPLNVWFRQQNVDGSNVFVHHLTSQVADRAPRQAAIRS
ncbi:hypothetical protein VHEMI03071 [[Torrubiella] hemipterigena]|uniref:Uncharacterized protein n=1 Tax=[Torrubiella] hemipterigena TaxID=1531966 RepID=A0A0A1TCC5_9HYPO|nr:hypothetical protein VHEMI03071 [[Torrubiella] hemipterigena]